MTGTLYAVGVGPGDPELMTIKTFRLIQSGALIAYPVGSDSGESLARRIAAPIIEQGTEEFGFPVPMRVEREPAATAYDNAAAHLAEQLNNGRDVVLLCEGDPFFYGSAMYVVNRLTRHFPCEIVPGVTSLTACAAVVGRPLAARNEKLKVLPAPLEEEELEAELKETEAAAIIKVGRHFAKVKRVLVKLGLAESAIIVESATDQKQSVRVLTDLAEGERPYFSTILVYQGKEAWGTHE